MVLPGEGREEEGPPESFGRSLLDHLELGSGERICHHLSAGEEPLSQEGEQSQTP
jgi:hypothetical protein